MTTMTRKRAEEIQAAREELRAMLAPGDVVTVLSRHVARSGMTRWLDLYATVDGELVRITEPAATAMGDRTYYLRSEGLWMVKAEGCGMDMHFATVYNLSRSLWPHGYMCTGDNDAPRKRCGSNDHANDYGAFAREYDESRRHAALLAECDPAARESYVAARQAYVSGKLATSYDPSRVHSDGGYALTHRTL